MSKFSYTARYKQNIRLGVNATEMWIRPGAARARGSVLYFHVNINMKYFSQRRVRAARPKLNSAMLRRPSKRNTTVKGCEKHKSFKYSNLIWQTNKLHVRNNKTFFTKGWDRTYDAPGRIEQSCADLVRLLAQGLRWDRNFRKKF